MPKQRKTRRDKLATSRRTQAAQGFVVNEEWLKTKEQKEVLEQAPETKSFLKADLTKTGILTMLVLALELAIWNYLSRH